MTPFYFGPPDRRLFAIFHPGERTGDARGGVVLAAPFGHEAIRTHRFYRVLADRLARLGHDVIRFDYHGAGDSAGDDGDASLSGWAGDIVSAHHELTARAGVAPSWWVGARLGATAALLASAQVDPVRLRPALALWDPIVDGRAYLGDLRRRHVEALEMSFSIPDPRWRQGLAGTDAYLDEAIGFAIPPSFRDEILAVAPSTLNPRPDTLIRLLCSPVSQAASAWAALHSPALGVRMLAQDFEWTSDDSLNTALVPGDALAALLRMVDEPRH